MYGLFFKVRLATYLAVFVVQLAITNLRLLTTVFLTSLLTIVVLLAAAANIQLAKQEAVTQQIKSITFVVPGSRPIPATRTQVEILIQQQEQILETQPQHRDALLNVALLYSTLEKTEAAQTKWDQARALDPNHSAFTQ